MGIIKEHFSSKNPGAKLEVTSKRGVLSSQVVNAGEIDEKAEFRFTGRIKKNKTAVLGTIKLSADKVGSIYPNHLNKIPNLIKGDDFGFNSNIKLKLRETIKDPNYTNSGSIRYNNNTISYLFDVIYTAKENVNKINPLRYYLNNTKSVKNIQKPTLTRITSLKCGDAKVSPHGEERAIVLTGDPNAPYRVAVVKINETFEKSTDAKGHEDILRSTTNYESILSRTVANSTYDEISVVEGRLDSTGKYSFIQKFPKSNSNTRYSINLNYEGVSVARGWFPSNKYITKLKGSFDYYPEIKDASNLWNLGSQLDGWENWYCKTLTQQLPRKVVVRATTNSVLYTINRQGIPAGASAQTVDRVIWKGNKVDKVYNFKYYVEVVSPSTSLTKAAAHLTFDGEGGSPNQFTGDTNYQTNGSTMLVIDNIVNTNVVSGCTSGKCYLIEFTLRVAQWGTKDILITLPLNTFINIAP